MAEGSDIRLGDLLASVTKKLGIRECSRCAMRRVALNMVAVRGRKVSDVLRETLGALLVTDFFVACKAYVEPLKAAEKDGVKENNR